MSNLIKSIKIKNLFNEKQIHWELQKINVLVGKNGLGKSTILRLINSAVTRKHCDALDLCEEIVLEFDNERKCVARKNNEIDPDFVKLFLKKVTSSSDFSKSIEDSISKNPKSKKLSPNDLEKIKLEIFEKINETAVNFSKETDINRNILRYDFESSVKKMNVELISTINMSANSINNVTTSSGNKTTFLDLEIDNEIKRLNKNSKIKNSMQKKLVDSLNNLFEETNKKTSFIDDELKITLTSGRKIDYRSLSSGERQVIFIFLKIINGSVDKSLILMDEPEISLHLSWQEKLLTEITKVNSLSQIIIVTHSPAMVMNGWLDSFVDIKNITKEL